MLGCVSITFQWKPLNVDSTFVFKSQLNWNHNWISSWISYWTGVYASKLVGYLYNWYISALCLVCNTGSMIYILLTASLYFTWALCKYLRLSIFKETDAEQWCFLCCSQVSFMCRPWNPIANKRNLCWKCVLSQDDHTNKYKKNMPQNHAIRGPFHWHD